jgi:hypothetical protein
MMLVQKDEVKREEEVLSLLGQRLQYYLHHQPPCQGGWIEGPEITSVYKQTELFRITVEAAESR